mmetsp:Transcript_66387/g.187034  ORF Transcript_66387/g.187034 Transcript_66387/m.187034 type:complete len:109 (+) Transcript_66387:57-383(+)
MPFGQGGPRRWHVPRSRRPGGASRFVRLAGSGRAQLHACAAAIDGSTGVALGVPHAATGLEAAPLAVSCLEFGLEADDFFQPDQPTAFGAVFSSARLLPNELLGELMQ